MDCCQHYKDCYKVCSSYKIYYGIEEKKEFTKNTLEEMLLYINREYWDKDNHKYLREVMADAKELYKDEIATLKE